MDSGLEYSTKGLQSVCTVGIGSFDELIGGGFALTSINIIDEDQHQIYGSMLIKAFVSSAIHSQQDLLIFSPNITSKKCRFFKELPSLQMIKDDPLEGGKFSPAKDYSKMKIAFRYANLPSKFSESQSYEQKFDFGNHLDESLVNKANIRFYEHDKIIEVLKEKSDLQSSSIDQSVCRIWIDQICSPLSLLDVSILPRFMHRLKMLMRRLSKSVCLMNVISSALLDNDLLIPPMVRQRLYFEADSVIKLVAFDDDDEGKNPYSQDYEALVQLLHLSRLNSLAPYNPSLESTEYGLKIHTSKRFIHVEQLSLPPDSGEMVNRFTSSSQAADAMLTPSKMADF